MRKIGFWCALRGYAWPANGAGAVTQHVRLCSASYRKRWTCCENENDKKKFTFFLLLQVSARRTAAASGACVIFWRHRIFKCFLLSMSLLSSNLLRARVSMMNRLPVHTLSNKLFRSIWRLRLDAPRTMYIRVALKCAVALPFPYTHTRHVQCYFFVQFRFFFRC